MRLFPNDRVCSRPTSALLMESNHGGIANIGTWPGLSWLPARPPLPPSDGRLRLGLRPSLRRPSANINP